MAEKISLQLYLRMKEINKLKMRNIVKGAETKFGIYSVVFVWDGEKVGNDAKAPQIHTKTFHSSSWDFPSDCGLSAGWK